MTEPVFHQEPEGISARAIWLVAGSVVALSAGLIAIAWLLVVPPTAADRPVSARSPLEHDLIDSAAGGAQIRAAGAHQLERYEWIDRKARLVRIPIDRAIDAVVADPQLIATPAAPPVPAGGISATDSAAAPAAPSGAASATSATSRGATSATSAGSASAAAGAASGVAAPAEAGR